MAELQGKQLDVLSKQLDVLNKEVANKEAELATVEDRLEQKPKNANLLKKQERLIAALNDLNVQRKELQGALRASVVGQASAYGAASSAGEDAGSPTGKLRLRQDSENKNLYFFDPLDPGRAAPAASADVGNKFFLDPDGKHITRLRAWLQLVNDQHGKGEHIVPLFINGLVKSGKSYMLNEVLPAGAIAFCGEISSGSGSSSSGRSINFLRVTCLGIDRANGNRGFLKEFLLGLKQSAADEGLSAAASTPVPSDTSAYAMALAIQTFMRRLPRDRLNFVLVDEAQSFFLMEMASSDGLPPGSTLDMAAVRHMRRLLKELLLKSPPWVAWAVTGSSMATLWANVAATPTNGFALIQHHRRLNLSPTVPADVLRVAWKRLKAQDPTLPSDLVWQSPQQIAMLAYMCQEWRNSGTTPTARELVQQTLWGKLIPEVLVDLRIVLVVLGKPASQIVMLRELLDPTAGVERAKLPLAFDALLGSFAIERGGRLYLDNPLLAGVLQATTTESGELLDAITDVPSLSSAMYRELVTLGEYCKDPAFATVYVELYSLLEDMAAALPLTPDELVEAKWFVKVLDHDGNSSGAKARFEETWQKQPDVTVVLQGYHGLLCNILSHSPPPTQQEFLEAYPPQLAAFHSDGRISAALTKTCEGLTGGHGSTGQGAAAAVGPLAQVTQLRLESLAKGGSGSGGGVASGSGRPADSSRRGRGSGGRGAGGRRAGQRGRGPHAARAYAEAGVPEHGGWSAPGVGQRMLGAHGAGRPGPLLQGLLRLAAPAPRLRVQRGPMAPGAGLRMRL